MSTGLHQTGRRHIRLLATEDVDRAVLDALADGGVAVEAVRTAGLAAAIGQTAEPCAILWQYPLGRIADALQAGRDPVEACQDWLSCSRTILELNRRNRRQVLLADARLLVAGAPEALRARLAERLGLDALPAPVQRAEDAGQRLARGLAELVLPQIDTVSACLDDLLTSSLALPPHEIGQADLARVAQDFAGQAERQSAVHAREIAQHAERAALLAAQFDLQRKAAEQMQAALVARLQKAMHEADQALSRALEDLRDEAKRRNSAERQRDRLIRRVGDLTSKLEKTFSSTSWRVTRPLRRIKMLVGGGERPVDLVLLDEKRRESKAR